MNQFLMRAIVEFAVFLGLGSDRVVEPDAAVTQLEQLASILTELKQEEHDIFAKYIEQLAIAEQSNAGNSERVEFLLSLPENLGIKS